MARLCGLRAMARAERGGSALAVGAAGISTFRGSPVVCVPGSTGQVDGSPSYQVCTRSHAFDQAADKRVTNAFIVSQIKAPPCFCCSRGRGPA
jgi:hypothetical protein